MVAGFLAGSMCRAAAIAATTVGAACNNVFSANPYPAILDNFDLTPDSSDEAIQNALEAMQEKYAKSCPAGATIAVTRRSGNSYNRIVVSNGNKDFCEKDKPITDDTLFEIGSISKPFTAILLSRAVVEGILSLETPVNDLLPASANIPDLVVNGTRITLGQLVTHTAGLPRSPPKTSMIDRTCDNEKFLQAIRIAAEDGLDQSGSFSYSNFGFNILAFVLSRSLDTLFADLQNTMTRDHLNLTNTWVSSIPQQIKEDHLATGYLGPFPALYWYDDNSFCIDGSGSTVSSGNDLSQFIEAIMAAYYNNTTKATTTTSGTAGSLIQQALLHSLMPIVFDDETNGNGRGYAWGFDQYGSEEGAIYFHDGQTLGFHSLAVFQPKTQTGVIAMSNCCGSVVGGGVSVWSMAVDMASRLMLLSNDMTLKQSVFQQQHHDESTFHFLH